MNKTNLQKIIDHIKTIPGHNITFDFKQVLNNDKFTITPECDDIGNIMEHCVILDVNLFNAIKKNAQESTNMDLIDIFITWFSEYTNVNYLSPEFVWCCGGYWANIDNTKEGQILRLEWLINNGLPENWIEQMAGLAPLCYK